MPLSDDAPPSLRVTLLGTGTSTGVPVLGCDCHVCTSADPHDERLRCACYIEAGPLGILIDAGPDFRQQARRAHIERIDAVCFTHHHFDHVAGIDDLRPLFYRNSRPMPCYSSADTAEILRERYAYIFGDNPYPGAARVTLRAVEEGFTITSRYDDAGHVNVQPIPMQHGNTPTTGWRFGPFAYLTDAHHIPDESVALLDGVEVIVLDALRARPHPTHFSFDGAVEMARRIGARETYFIHMTHDVLHADQEARLPEDIHLGYDGLQIEVDRTPAEASAHTPSDVQSDT